MTTPAESIRLDYLAVGARHSGTRYIAELLTGADFICGHEFLFRLDGIRDPEDTDEVWRGVPWWKMLADSSWAAAEHLDHPCVSDAVLLHVVRDPLAVIRSWCWVTGKRRTDQVPVGELERYAEELVVFNSQIEMRGGDRQLVRLRVEDRQSLLPQIPGVEAREVPASYDNPATNRHYTGRPDDVLTWRDFGRGYWANCLRDQAERYGY